MEHAAVVDDRSLLVALAVGDVADVLEEAVAFLAELVGPGVGAGAAPGVGAEAVEVAGAEQLQQAAVGCLDGGVGPPQLAQMGRGEELVPPDVADNREITRLQCAVLEVLAAAVLDCGAVVAVRFEVAGGDGVHG